MRQADLAEVFATGTDPVRALHEGIRRSVHCWVATVDGRPACVFGVAPIGSLLSDTGAPWMLGTDLITQHQRAFMRRSPRYIAHMLDAFSHLLNFVHAENEPSVRWLKRMGFTLHEPAPHGPNGALFHRFELRAAREDLPLAARTARRAEV